jgi:hypothetical protein
MNIQEQVDQAFWDGIVNGLIESNRKLAETGDEFAVRVQAMLELQRDISDIRGMVAIGNAVEKLVGNKPKRIDLDEKSFHSLEFAVAPYVTCEPQSGTSLFKFGGVCIGLYDPKR